MSRISVSFITIFLSACLLAIAFPAFNPFAANHGAATSLQSSGLAAQFAQSAASAVSDAAHSEGRWVLLLMGLFVVWFVVTVATWPKAALAHSLEEQSERQLEAQPSAAVPMPARSYPGHEIAA